LARFSKTTNRKTHKEKIMTENVKKLYRSNSDRMIAGICGGLGEYFAVDSTLIRLIFVIGSIFSFSALFWIYIIMLIVVPEEPVASQAVVDTPAATSEPVVEERAPEETSEE
jgi:phage shock protein PspC (stress-responsive transcriptional regulator)